MTTFDNSLATFADWALGALGQEAVNNGAFLRDVNGQLILLLNSIPPEIEHLRESAKFIKPYVDLEVGPVASFDELGESDTLSGARQVLITTGDGKRLVRLIDRRIIGQDWTALPARGWRAPSAARLVFWSMKGGVGRSTALAVAAVHLARSGKKVLALDLDLEAPGLGATLLDRDNQPRFGALDWLVESGLSKVDDTFLANMCAPSILSGGAGLLTVVPAVGSSGLSAPENMIAKLGRAYLEKVAEDGTLRSFLAQVAEMVASLEKSTECDVSLVDVRAGLNESTASSLLGLGADILMFGVNTPQTFDGYRYLLAHLRDLPVDPEDDWRLRFKMIHAMASLDIGDMRSFQDKSYQLFTEFSYESEEEPSAQELFNFDINDPEAPHSPWIIARDTNYLQFNPLQYNDQLSERIYNATFGDLLNGIANRVNGA